MEEQQLSVSQFDIVPILKLTTPGYMNADKIKQITDHIHEINTILLVIKHTPYQSNDVRHIDVCGISYNLEQVKFGTPYNTSLGVAVAFGRQIANGKMYGIEISEKYLKTVLKGLQKIKSKSYKQTT